MKFVVFCYTVIIITVTVSCDTTNQTEDESQLVTTTKQVSKRETSVIIDTMGPSSTDSVLINRVSRTRPRRKQKPKRKPPPSKLHPPRPYPRRYKPRPKGAYPKKAPSRYQTLPGKRIRYRKPFPVLHKSKRKQRPKPYETIKEPIGFGEPPGQPLGYQQLHMDNAEFIEDPPTDSYGAPLKTVNDNYHTITGNSYDNAHQQNKYAPNFNFEQFDFIRSPDSSYASSKKRPAYHVEPETNDPIMFQETGLDSYADVYKVSHDQVNNNIKTMKHGKKNVYNHLPKNILLHRWRAHENHGEKDHVLVGGQYAEPPGRYIPKHKSNKQFMDEDDSFSASFDTFAASSNISPYVNYKNGNIAFSPQNLNDAFGIVDK